MNYNVSGAFFYFKLHFSKPEQTVICLHSHPIRPGPDSHSLGLKRLGFGQRLHVKSQKSKVMKTGRFGRRYCPEYFALLIHSKLRKLCPN